MIFAFLSNNWLSLLISIVILAYNVYSKIKSKNSFNIIIDDMKGNLNSSNNIGFKYKVKFVFYILLSIYSLCYAILSNYDDEETYESLKIFS